MSASRTDPDDPHDSGRATARRAPQASPSERADDDPGTARGERAAREGTADGLADAVGERVLALVDEGMTTVRLALAETRLAASAAALLLGLVIVGAALLIVVWLLLVALAGVALAALGLGPATTLALLLLAHLVALAALALLARALARELAFARTRSALAARRPPAVAPDAAPDADAEAPAPAAATDADRASSSRR